jgi:hypothetical protein
VAVPDTCDIPFNCLHPPTIQGLEPLYWLALAPPLNRTTRTAFSSSAGEPPSPSAGEPRDGGPCRAADGLLELRRRAALPLHQRATLPIRRPTARAAAPYPRRRALPAPFPSPTTMARTAPPLPSSDDSAAPPLCLLCQMLVLRRPLCLPRRQREEDKVVGYRSPAARGASVRVREDSSVETR